MFFSLFNLTKNKGRTFLTLKYCAHIVSVKAKVRSLRNSSHPVPLPDRCFHWSLWPVASFVIRAGGIVCVVSSVVSFCSQRPRLESYRLSQKFLLFLSCTLHYSTVLVETTFISIRLRAILSHSVQLPIFWHGVSLLEQFSIECRKTETKAITPASHSRPKQCNEPIRIRSNDR